MYKKQIVGIINSLSRSRSSRQVFDDWIECSALAIQNSCYISHNSLWEKREQQYLRCIKPYGKFWEKFAEMLSILVIAMEHEMSDILGNIFMELEGKDKHFGQFFTPFGVSQMCASILLKEEDGSHDITLSEPASGAGGMVIAAAKFLHDKGINYQRCLVVTAQDLDWRCVYMCYIQLSLLGINATVVQGNTLTEPYTEQGYPPERVFYTPKRLGLLI